MKKVSRAFWRTYFWLKRFWYTLPVRFNFRAQVNLAAERKLLQCFDDYIQGKMIILETDYGPVEVIFRGDETIKIAKSFRDHDKA